MGDLVGDCSSSWSGMTRPVRPEASTTRRSALAIRSGIRQPARLRLIGDTVERSVAGVGFGDRRLELV